MGKITKSLFKLVTSSLIVWLIVVMIFAKNIVFNNNEDVPDDQNTIPDGAVFKDGVYTGSAIGHNRGELVVEVTIVEGKISNVVIVEHSESEEISDPAIEGIPAAIVESNSLDVDTVTGATVSSKAIIEAVKNALISSIDDSGK